MSDIEVLEGIEQGDNRPSVYEEVVDGLPKWVYRASSVGNCFRNLVAARLGMIPAPPPGWMMERYQQGIDNEPVILEMLRGEGEWKLFDTYELENRGVGDNGYRTVGGQLEVVVPIGETVMIRGHVDGVGQCYNVDINLPHVGIPNEPALIPFLQGKRVVVEVKAFAKSMWEQFCKKGVSAFPYYEWQTSIYGLALNLPVLFVVGRKDEDGKVVEIKKQYIDQPAISPAQIKMKVAKVEAVAATGQLPDLCDYRQFPCGYYWLGCVDKELPESFNVEDDLLDSLAQQYAEGQKLESEGKKKKKAAKDGINAWFDGRKEAGEGVESVTTQQYVIEDFQVDMPESTRGAYTMRYPKITPKDEIKTKDKELTK